MSARMEFDSDFTAEAEEKATRTLEYLELLGTHPDVRGKICLHGGTALNLFVLYPERLSLDADLNFLGNGSAVDLEPDRIAVEDALCAVARELGYEPRPGKPGHAGRTFKLLYQSQTSGGSEFLKVDLDFMNRVPLFDPVKAESTAGIAHASFPINAPIEVVAGKLKALCERVVPRDLFDIGRAATNRDDWTTGDQSLDHAVMLFYFSLATSFPKNMDVLGRFDDRDHDVEQILWPVLPAGNRPTAEQLREAASAFVEWATTPQNVSEAEYLARLSCADYSPELLFGNDRKLLARAQSSPAMAWKIKNLKRGISKGLVDPLPFPR
jgi:hypothetical protein